MARRVTSMALIAAAMVAFLVSPAAAQDDRVSGSEKGSLLIFPKVEVWWKGDGKVIADTFVDLTNDYPDAVQVQMYFIDGDYCQWVDVGIELTADEPCFWSAATGLPKGVSPWSVLAPGNPPGYPHPTLPNVWVLRGYIIAWAVDEFGEEILWNHLKGDALLVTYPIGEAWEYNAFAFQAIPGRAGLPPQHGDLTGTPGELYLNGVEYDAGFDLLLLDFYAVGASLPPVVEDIDLTLLPISVDLRQDGDGGRTTKAKFDIWNENEVKFSGTERCITCWDQTWLGDYSAPNHFLVENLHTDKGKARIDGLASTVCPGSTAESMLGLSMTQLRFCAAGQSDTSVCKRAQAGRNLVGMGYDYNGVIKADITTEPPPSQPAMESGSVSAMSGGRR